MIFDDVLFYCVEKYVICRRKTNFPLMAMLLYNLSVVRVNYKNKNIVCLLGVKT